MTTLALVAPVHHKPIKHHHKHHRKGCHSARCDRWVDRRWSRLHRPKFHFRPFELCVANRESGEPGSYSYSTINWRYSGDYEGAYNWVNSTWLAMGGGRYAQHAYDAPPREQTLIFRAHANSHDWPLTVPACS
jgi:hypothetical protein